MSNAASRRKNQSGCYLYLFPPPYSTADGSNLSEVLLPPDLQTGPKDGAYNVAFQFSHSLTDNPDRPLGFYLKGALADGNPNPIQSSLLGGIAGKGLLASRRQDSFGAGYFYYNFSDDLQSAVAPAVNFKNEQGVELFYNCAVTPWWHITADVQFISPANGNRDDQVVFGLRSSVAF